MKTKVMHNNTIFLLHLQYLYIICLGFNAELTECYKLPEGLEDDQLAEEIMSNPQLAINFPSRRTFVKSTSLSTIAEEKTLNNNTLQSSVHKLGNQSDSSSNASVNGRVVIQRMLDEFKSKNTFINEIMHVFEPSSKEGTFNRNVPIRFSSPFKYNKVKQKSDLRNQGPNNIVSVFC